MDILPDDIQDTIYKYKHQMEYRNVMEHLKVSVCYCGWCGDKQWIWTDCDCWQARKQRGEDYDDPYQDEENDEWNEMWEFYEQHHDEMYGIQ